MKNRKLKMVSVILAIILIIGLLAFLGCHLLQMHRPQPGLPGQRGNLDMESTESERHPLQCQDRTRLRRQQ